MKGETMSRIEELREFYGEEPDDCPVCGESFCDHARCGCDDGCPDCWNQRHNKIQADMEAAYQRDVIGPMLGFEEETRQR